jgi:hypothetical protein
VPDVHHDVHVVFRQLNSNAILPDGLDEREHPSLSVGFLRAWLLQQPPLGLRHRGSRDLQTTLTATCGTACCQSLARHYANRLHQPRLLIPGRALLGSCPWSLDRSFALSSIPRTPSWARGIRFYPGPSS